MLSGNATEGSDTFEVEWLFGGGPAELMTIAVPGGSTIASGGNILTFPATLTTDTVGATLPPPVPEPSSLLLLGTGSLSLAAAGLRRMRSAIRS